MSFFTKCLLPETMILKTARKLTIMKRGVFNTAQGQFTIAEENVFRNGGFSRTGTVFSDRFHYIMFLGYLKNALNWNTEVIQ